MNNNIKNLILLFTISINITKAGDIGQKNNAEIIKIFKADKFDINSNNGDKRANCDLIEKYLKLKKNNHKNFKLKTGK